MNMTYQDIQKVVDGYMPEAIATSNRNKGIAGKAVLLTDPTDAQILEYDKPTDSFVNVDQPKPNVDTPFLSSAGGVNIGQLVFALASYVSLHPVMTLGNSGMS